MAIAARQSYLAPIVCLTILFILPLPAHSQGFDFFYFVQQWPGSYCSQSCCYPTTGKPASAFSIHGLWPQNSDGSYPSNCDGDAFDPSLISDLKPQLQRYWGSLSCPSSDGESFWSHEWSKHGTCSGLDQHSYFQAALNLAQNADVLSSLQNAGITDDGSSYSVSSIKNALASGIGQTPGIECNRDSSGTRQLYQVYTCVDKDASTIIQCPTFPSSGCGSRATIPSF